METGLEVAVMTVDEETGLETQETTTVARQEVPVAGSYCMDGPEGAKEFIPLPPQEPVEIVYTQEEWDAIRQRKIESLEREAQTKMLEALTEANVLTLPTNVEVIRTIRAADEPGSDIPTGV